MKLQSNAAEDQGMPASLTDIDLLRYAAFTDDGIGGNPAGVVLGAASLSDESCLAVAARAGYSETAFVEESPGAREFRVRFFSPRAEVAFCGHATIATAVALAQCHGAGTFRFHTLAGPIDVSTQPTDCGYSATLTSVPTHTRPATDDEVSAALEALRWNAGDLDPNYSPHVAYGGNEHLVLAAVDRVRLAELDYDYPRLDSLMSRHGWTTLQLVHAHGPLLFSSRNPFPPGGVVEDPATGAAAAAFGGYLRTLGLVDLPARVTMLQGHDMGRPSRLILDLTHGDRVQVTGAATII